MADDVTYTAGANATPPDATKAATDETTAGPHSAGSHMGIAKLAVSADGDSTHIPATAADGLLVQVSNPTAGTGLTDAELRASPVDVDGSGVTQPISAAALPLPAGAATAANQLPDGHNVTVDNGAGAAAVNIQDGGNTITVDGTVTANQGAAGTAWEVVGDVANDVAVPANPVVVGGRASDALPTEVSGDGDAVYQWLLRNGAAMTALIPHLGMLGDPYTLTSETAQYTTTQTSTALVSPGAGQRIAVTSIQIQAGGTTAGTLQVYFGDGAYSRGTSLAIFDGEFAPSATLKPGFAMAPPKPWVGGADEELRVTDSAAIDPLTITVWFYLIG